MKSFKIHFRKRDEDGLHDIIEIWVTPRQLYAHPKNWLKEFKALQPNIL